MNRKLFVIWSGVMKQRKNVICVNSNNAFLDKKRDELQKKKLDDFFYPFTDFKSAVTFIKEEGFAEKSKIHYLILDEDILNPKPEVSFNKLSELNKTIKRMDIIVLTNNNRVELRNKIIRHPFVNAYLIKPIPENYIEFLITGA